MLNNWKDYWIIKKSGLFDSIYYLMNNPDVRRADVDPLMHFVKYGWKEGRNPSEKFDTSYYLNAYPDVKEAGINPLFHYIRHGKSEGRLPQEIQDETNFEKTITDEKCDVSIIIPIYNAAELTKACIDKLYRSSGNYSFEVIVIDNCSTDQTESLLIDEQKNRQNFSFYRMQENLGFSGGVNFGFSKSKGEYIVILNNDTLVTPGWLDRILEVFKSDSSIGIISPVTNYVGEGPQLDAEAKEIHPEEIDEYADKIKEKGYVYEPIRLVFFCVVINRAVFDLLGYLDLKYEKGNFEDDDYCLRTRILGYKLAIARNCFVFHYGSATFNLNKISHSEWMEKNKFYFYQKAERIATSLRHFKSDSAPQSVSIIVRTQNRPKLLVNALTSIANQTHHNFEVVLVNDGGEDVQSIVQIFSAYYPITYIYNQDSIGRTAAINAGLRAAKGDWIGFLDDDDIIYPWHLELLLDAARQNNASMVYGNHNRVLFQNMKDPTPEKIVEWTPWEFNRNQLLVNNYIPINSYLFRHDLLESIGFWSEELERLEDYDFLLRLSTVCNFYHVNKVVNEYRFYLDMTNTIFVDRHKNVPTLFLIYQKYPVEEEILIAERQKTLDCMKNQSEIIDLLLKKVQAKEIDINSARREIVALTAGV